MNRNEIVRIIKNFIEEEGNLDDYSILQEDTDLFDSGLVDSLMIVKIISFCESKFVYNLKWEELTEDNFKSIGNMANLIIEKAKSSQKIETLNIQ